MEKWFHCFLFGISTYFLFSSIGKLIDKTGITLENFTSTFLKIRECIPIGVSVSMVVFLMYFVSKCIKNIM